MRGGEWRGGEGLCPVQRGDVSLSVCGLGVYVPDCLHLWVFSLRVYMSVVSLSFM